jgi:phosphate starvation-inducible protein PhoH
MTEKRLTRKQRRIQQSEKREIQDNQIRLNFQLKNIEPLTNNQRLTFDAYEQGKNLLLHGIAGTGKSFLSIYLSLQSILSDTSRYKRLVLIRSVVPTRDMGFLPGNNKEKAKVYEAPYQAIFTELFGRSDAYEFLKGKNLVEFISTSFIRGITLNDSIIVVDEMQNMDWGELCSVITRIGKNCKIMFCGDFRQSDFRFREKDSKDDILKFMKVLKNMKSDFEFIEFGTEDIVRSKLVKNFIISLDNLGYSV